ncbi:MULTISPECIES: hypothetical protein [unclassified Bradyrhizobium]|uniref:hypothetical protein n=1 Tax=unclassified Bradyrhizobium TaxID=2631580 RepID=UPI001BA5F407|nr:MULTISPECIES: hypothetical protein [unclassified Bradyrhizobium]MBR1206825.1 hypothetical protein [Bradyrhizobium sp. AUGA SZCCT0124]MBR1313364.1 hypothetical protein [Bradyrhizobium sp. AUGA SZCCT0051]MBR1345536.1 hypothetical protein [Bradyrhizobium sp. AUGA SZCCT0105]MBR1357041.1 hypothetical protein [Bradyrhizobium sp. AUGA SZCCT0045]
MSDPTDNALAAIASILDQTTTPPEKSKPSDTKSSDKAADNAPEPAEEPPVSIAMPPPLPTSIEVVTVEAVSIKTESMDTATAEPTTVEPASIEESELLVEQSEPSETEPSEPEPSVPEPEPIPPPQPIEANGYSKSGPGPMAALRFRWTVREDGAQYYVDETVGEGSTPLVNGPMDRDAAIKFVDDREAEARRRFEHFKHEIVSRTAAALQASKDRHEA